MSWFFITFYVVPVIICLVTGLIILLYEKDKKFEMPIQFLFLSFIPILNFIFASSTISLFVLHILGLT